MWKNTAELDRPQRTIWCTRIACCITKATNTLTICNTHCFSTTTMVARTRLNVTLYAHCLSCLISFLLYILLMLAFRTFLTCTEHVGLQRFHGKVLHPLLWAGSQAARVNINKWYTKLPKLLWNFSNIYRVFKCGRESQCWRPMAYSKQDTHFWCVVDRAS